MKVIHRKGQRHGNADALSRLVRPSGTICKQCEMPWNYAYDGPKETEISNFSASFVSEKCQGLERSKSELFSNEANCAVEEDDLEHVEDDQEAPEVIIRQQRGRKINKPTPARQKQIPVTSLTNDEIRRCQLEDVTLSEILQMKVEGRDKPSWNEISSKDPQFKFWIGRWELLEVHDGVLCIYWEEYKNGPRWRICAPDALKGTVLWFLHDAHTAGHMGVKKTWKKAISCPFYWQGMHQFVKDYVNCCEICEERKNPARKKRHSMKLYSVGGPFERVATDIAGPFPLSYSQNKYILVVADYFTKLTECYPLKDIQAETVADVIFRGWIKRYGCMLQLEKVP